MVGESRADRADTRELTQLTTRISGVEAEFDQKVQTLNDLILGHAQILDKIESDMVDDRPRSANVPLVPFYGNRNEDFAQYIKQFELICNANNYAQDRRAQILASYLRDKAFYVYDSLPEATKTNYDNLKRELLNKFQSSDYKRFAHQNFQERKQKYTETVTEYGCEIHRLGLAALSAINDADQRDALIREKFIAGLIPELHELIVYSNPQTFHEAMTLAERLEGLQEGKRSHNARNIMLLEGIHDRLQKLEIGQRDPESESMQQSYAVQDIMPKRYVDRQWNQRPINLNNYRQELGPRGNKCYQCNRFGHIARNCPRTTNANSIICRLCNRPGHFARDCQRRMNRPYVPAVHPPAARNTTFQNRGPATFPNNVQLRRNPAMAAIEETGRQGEPENRWKPLVASLIIPSVGKERSYLKRTTDNPPRRYQDFAPTWIKGYGQRVGERKRSWSVADLPSTRQSSAKKVRTMSAEHDTRERCFIRRKKQGELLNLGQRQILILICAIICWWFSYAQAEFYHDSAPMLCQTYRGRMTWQMPNSLSCPSGNHTSKREVRPVELLLYKRNYVQYRSNAWKCIKIKQETETFTYFFGDENLKKEKKYPEPVSAEECMAMKNFLRCGTQPMARLSGIFQTTNELNWYYPGGGINCCKWKKFTATNCYMFKSAVYKRHFSPKMESTAGDVSRCPYEKGQCVLEDGSFLLWDVNNQSSCSLVPWKSLPGKMFGSGWLSDDSNLALTFTQRLRTTDCQGKPLKLSDQGIAVKIKFKKTPRRKRGLRHMPYRVTQQQRRYRRQTDQLPETSNEDVPDPQRYDGPEYQPRRHNQVGKLASQGGFVSSAQLAASLEAIELRWKQNINFAFSHALNGVCNYMKSVVELLKTQIIANPTMAIRWLVNQSAIFVTAGGDLIEIFPCEQLKNIGSDFQFLAMNRSCSAWIPIKFWIHKLPHYGYMDPITNIIHRHSIPSDCNLVKQIPVKLWGKNFFYDAKTGEIEEAKKIPTLKALQWNVESVIDVHPTIYHEVVIYSWEELQSHISLNDIMGGLTKQREVLKHLGVSDEDDDPAKAAEGAVSKIMNVGYFGFLRGLTANAFQVWTFMVCLYVTLCIAIVHCLPIGGMPPVLNFSNAFFRIKDAYRRWRRKQDHMDEATSEAMPKRWINSRFTTNRSGFRRQQQYTTALELSQVPPSVPRSIADEAVSSLALESRQDINFGTSRGDETSTKKTTEVQPFRVDAASGEATITALIDNMQVCSLLDSGSSLTIIPYSIAKQLRREIKPGPIVAVSMSGHQLPIVGETEAIVRVGNKEMHGRIVVANEAPYDLIIGTDLMKQLGTVQFDFEKRTIVVGDQHFAMKKQALPAKVYLCQQVRIPPRTKAMVMGWCDRIKPRTQSMSGNLFLPSSKLQQKYEVMGQEALVTMNEGLIPVTLINADPCPKFLPEKATLGHLEDASEDEIFAVEESTITRKSDVRTPQQLEEFRKQINIPKDLSLTMRNALERLLMRYEQLFARSDYDLGETPLIEHEIGIGNARPIKQQPYRTPHSLRPYLTKKIHEMLEHGIIQPSKSAWGSPVVLVKKKDSDEPRFCVDNRRLNDVTIKDSYPLKRLEDAFDMMAGAKYFATMDLQSGFWQIPMRESDRDKTAFITFEGLFEFRKMNFGLCNAPATCQRLMDQVLRGLDWKICMSYIDHIIVPADSISQLILRLEQVFDRLLAARLKLKLKKCHFGKKELKFLGFLISAEGMRPDPDKIKKILEAHAPTNQDQLRMFLGLSGWCKRFIEGYAHLIEPLTTLLKKEPKFIWTPAADVAFQQLKERYTTAPILIFPDFTKRFIICTDASSIGIGAVLAQEDENKAERPISYDSRVLTKSERNYSTIEREMLAIYWAVAKKYRPYVYGHEFKIYTDHKPLIGVWNAPPNEGRLAKWCILLQEYRNTITIEYRPGKHNSVADFLSRNFGQAQEVLILSDTQTDGRLKTEQTNDPYFGPIIRYLQNAEDYDEVDLRHVQKRAASYEIINGILYRKSHRQSNFPVALPTTLRKDVLIAVHDSLLGGHLGVRKTLSKIYKKYFWPACYRDVMEWCRSCKLCQARKNPHKWTKAPLLPLETRSINQRWGWDICGPYPLSRQGNKYILVCTEYLSKFPEAFPIPDTKTERLAKILVENIVLRYGSPDILLSDQGSNVDSALIKEICKMLGISKLRSSAYHPQTDGQTERFNRTMNNMISMYVSTGHDDWCEFLPYLLFAYRTSVHETTKESSFFLMYGFDAHLPIDMELLPNNRVVMIDEDDYKLHVLDFLLRSRQIAVSRIQESQGKQKRYYDRNTTEPSFLVGDLVLMFTPASKKGRSRKLQLKWVGPYRILKIGKNGRNVCVKRPGERAEKEGTWVHVNRLKRHFADPCSRLDDVAIEPEREGIGATTAQKEVCGSCGKRGRAAKWIQCDTCNAWYHLHCVGVTGEPPAEEWECSLCRGNLPPVREKSDSGNHPSDDSCSTVITDEEADLPAPDFQPLHDQLQSAGHCQGITVVSSKAARQNKRLRQDKKASHPSNQRPTERTGYLEHKINTPRVNPASSELQLPCEVTTNPPVFLCNMLSVAKEPRRRQDSVNWLKQNYQVEEEIGSGGFGRVYGGLRIWDSLKVAIKAIPLNKVKRWTQFNERDVPLELVILIQCQGVEGVIKLYDWGSDAIQFYIVMDRPTIDGDLFSYITKWKWLQESVARPIFRQVTTIARECQLKGIYHRDIKEENILLNWTQGTVKLIDFGSAAHATLAPFADCPGTPEYFPPEWFTDKRYTGEEATVWSLGILLYSMLCGNVPYEDKYEILRNRIYYSRKLTEEAKDLVCWCLASPPGHRPRLEQVLNHPWVKGTTFWQHYWQSIRANPNGEGTDTAIPIPSMAMETPTILAVTSSAAIPPTLYQECRPVLRIPNVVIKSKHPKKVVAEQTMPKPQPDTSDTISSGEISSSAIIEDNTEPREEGDATMKTENSLSATDLWEILPAPATGIAVRNDSADPNPIELGQMPEPFRAVPPAAAMENSDHKPPMCRNRIKMHLLKVKRPSALTARPNGSLWERYTFGERIGRGGFGQVFAGMRISDGSPVAIKVIESANIKQWRPMGPDRVPLELEILLKCQNIQGIITVLDWASENNKFYIVMERISGDGDLLNYVRKRKGISENEARLLFKQICETVYKCHVMGIYHRDIKEENVVVDSARNKAVLIDFGSAAYAQATPYAVNHGTRLYSPPEWFSHNRYDGEPATVWSLGVLLFSMVEDELPFADKFEILANQIEYGSNTLTEEFQDLVEWCLSPKPADRPTISQICEHPWVTPQIKTGIGLRIPNARRAINTHLPLLEAKRSHDPLYGVNDLFTCAKSQVDPDIISRYSRLVQKSGQLNEMNMKKTPGFATRNRIGAQQLPLSQPTADIAACWIMGCNFNDSAQLHEHGRRYAFSTPHTPMSPFHPPLADGNYDYLPKLRSGNAGITDFP